MLYFQNKEVIGWKNKEEREKWKVCLVRVLSIPKENVRRISTYKPNVDQFDLSLICFTDTAHATLFTPHPLRPLPSSWLPDARPLLMPLAHSPPRSARYFVLYKTSCPVELFESRIFAWRRIFSLFSTESSVRGSLCAAGFASFV